MTAEPQPIREITDLEAYNEEEGLALSEEEIAYLQGCLLYTSRCV